MILEGAGVLLRLERLKLLTGSLKPRFTIEALGIRRLYRGRIWIEQAEGGLVLINVLPLQQYIVSVLFGEIPSLAGRSRVLEALKAQAVAIRSYTAYYLNPDRGRHPGKGYDFCDLTHCQVYRGDVPAGYRNIRRAVIETAGVVLRYRGTLVPGYYSSTCGGRTVSPQEVWGSGVLQAVFPGGGHLLHGKAPCRDSIHFRWRFEVVRIGFRDFFSAACFPVLSARDLQLVTGPGGSVRFLRVGETQIAGYRFRNLFCKKWGWNSLRSLCFTLEVTKDRVIFKGQGLGHRIGLCQYGAFAYAAAGYSWQRILNEYFPGVRAGK